MEAVEAVVLAAADLVETGPRELWEEEVLDLLMVERVEQDMTIVAVILV